MDSREKEKLLEQRKRVKAAREVDKKAIADSPKIRVVFTVQEAGNPDGTKPDLHFSYHGLKNYHLVHGRTYDLPTVVVEWLESRMIPVYRQYEPDEETRGMRSEPVDAASRIVGQTPRFNLQRIMNPVGKAPDGSGPETKQRKAA